MMKNPFVNLMSRICHRPSLTGLGLLCLTLAGGHAAQAQATLSLITDTPAVAVGSIVTVTVKLTGGTNLSAYNINIVIDPTRLQFVNTGAAYYTSTNASFVYLGSQVNTTTTPTGVSPGGDLNISGGNFSSLDNAGTVALGTFQVKVLSPLPPTGSGVSFGTLQAGGGYRNTNVMDPNNANEVTSATSLNLNNSVPISGAVSLDRVDPGHLAQPITFTITPTGTTTGAVTTQVVTLDATTGSFTLLGVPSGTYTISVKGAKWLRETATKVVDTTAGGISGVTFPTLPGGDATGDNSVNASDFLALRAVYGTTLGDGLYNAASDFNCDGSVNAQDFLILRSNFGTDGAPQ